MAPGIGVRFPAPRPTKEEHMAPVAYQIQADLSHGSHATGMMVEQWKARFTGGRNIYCNSRKLLVKMSAFAMVELLQQAITTATQEPSIYCPTSYDLFLENPKVFLYVNDYERSHTRAEMTYDRTFYLVGYGPKAELDAIFDYIDRNYVENKICEVSWAYLTKDGEEDRTLTLPEPKKSLDEFYPWIPGGLDDYFNTYLQSDEAVLILLGDAGTGKTSFIRNLLWRHALHATVTYEEELLGHDFFFTNFLFSESRVLVIEDADTFLLGRESDGNKLMSKFLNCGDGLVKFPDKKLIFTANMLDVSKVDRALLRPGRCFDYKVFRKLTYPETCLAAKAAGIPAPEAAQNYSLAELFAQSKQNKLTYSKQVGFAA